MSNISKDTRHQLASIGGGESWQNSAACVGENPEIFFPEPSEFGRRIAQLAKAVCDNALSNHIV